ncbi:claudin-8-like [Alosa sapidissima]|uniref:claudin-8-like n=1 Tax=Alosa sapidissima TaxID=34773 RepID=UPI001C09D9B2|nr:claudin-8-like [Alosa sapidissima]
MRGKLEILAMVFGILGLVGVATSTGLPMWRVTAFIGSNIIVMETMWEGLWMACYRHADIQMQCKVYDSLLILNSDIQAARGLMCAALVLSCIALLVSAFALRCTNCCRDDERGKNITLAVGGCLYLLSCLATLVPVSWTAHTIIRDFYDQQVMESQKRELGQALYVGWVSAAALLVAGALLLARYAPRSRKEDSEYAHAPATENEDEVAVKPERQASSLYRESQYV